MKIGVDAACWVNKRGHGRYTRELLRALLTLDRHNEYWFFLDRETALQCENLPESAQRIIVQTRQAVTQAAAAAGHRTLRDLWAMSQAVRRCHPHLDLFYFPSVYTFFPLRRPAKVLVTVHDVITERYPTLMFPTWRNRVLWQLKLRWALRQADVIATVSETAKLALMDEFKLPEHRVRVIPDAVSATFRPLHSESQSRQVIASFGIDDHERFILYVGGLSPHKNLITVINAYAALLREEGAGNLKLVLVGDFQTDVFYSNYRALQERVDAVGLSGKVLFTGWLSDRDLVHFYNAAELLVLASFDEGFGLPAVEAMACGTPVVASRAGALPEVLGDAGRFFDPHKPEELTQRLAELLADAQLGQELRERGLRRARDFSWERSARAALAAFAAC